MNVFETGLMGCSSILPPEFTNKHPDLLGFSLHFKLLTIHLFYEQNDCHLRSGQHRYG